MKVYSIFAKQFGSPGHYSQAVAEELKRFIEKGEYSQIANISFYGNTTGNEYLVCSIVYEEIR